MTDTARITAVVCTYDGREGLGHTIDSLLAQELPPDQFRLVVVDNAPARGESRAVLGRHSGNPALLLLAEPRSGLSNARNTALQATDTPFIAFIDDDAVASPGWLSHVLEAFAAFGERADVVGGPVWPAWGEERPTWLSNSMLTFLSIVDWGGERRIASPREWLAGTNIAFRAQRLRDVGGFATYLGRDARAGGLLSNEELDACRKLRASGSDLVYDPEVVVTHAVPGERLRQGWLRQRAAWQAVSDQLMDPGAAASTLGQSWAAVSTFLGTLPPNDRNMLALWRDVNDADQLRLQLRAIMAVTTLSLAGLPAAELPPDGGSTLTGVRRRLLPRWPRSRGRA